ncbi:uncharacterized protein [Dermacentor andersoni]|uniref:uncharacterized protein n=1 Tax=Dermacentor andersoni TaxID=34620 RepID=UPI00241767A2|nr:uncharacterized protein LOC129384848 [Dermacentor andersoni]
MGRRRKLADLSPQPVYWDPRYQRFFYAGLLPPLPQETPVAPRVELDPMKRTRRPSILVTGGDQTPGREERRERHISWSSLDDDDEGAAEDDPRGVAPAWRPVAGAMSLLVVISLMSLLAVAATLWATGSLEYAGRGAQTAGQDVTATTPMFGTTAPGSAAESSVRDRADFETGARAPAGKAGKPARNAGAPTTTLTGDGEAYTDTKAGTTRSRERRWTHRRSSRRETLRTTRVATESVKRRRPPRDKQSDRVASPSSTTPYHDLRRRRRRPDVISSNTRPHKRKG